MRRRGGASKAETDPPDEAHPGRRRWQRRAARSGISLLVLGVLGMAGALGWVVRGWVPSGGVGTTTTVVVKRPIQVPVSAPSGTLPNVLGLGIDQARQAYADAGVEPTAIVATDTPYFARAGSVIEQRPAAATALSKSTHRFELLVARQARIPDLVGVDGDQARARLAKIGIGATTVVRYEASVDPGEVARTRPKAREPARARATLVVSEAPSSVNIADLTADQNDCTLEQSTLTCAAGDGPATVRYSINDRVSGFEATLALAAGSPAGARARLAVRSAGRVVGSFEATANPRDIRVDLPGATRLVLELRRVGGGTSRVGVEVREARFVGARSGIDALVRGKAP